MYNNSERQGDKFMQTLKRVSDSITEHVQILCNGTLNGNDRLFGGQLMEWIDIVAAVVARRHSGMNVTTAVVDSLQFKEAAYINDTVVLIGHITYTGRTSMEICVKTYVEHLSGKRSLINKAYVVMVAIDENGRPTEVPKLILETDEEIFENEAAIKRSKLRAKRREENY